MDEETIKIIKEAFDNLPEVIQEEIFSPQYQEVLSTISREYTLDTEQTIALERETTLALMGAARLKDFEETLASEIKIEKAKIQEIVVKINEEIFSRFKTLLDIMNTEIEPNPEPNWQQNIDFVLSGGDYSSFFNKKADANRTEGQNKSKISGYSTENQSKIGDIKNKFLYNDEEAQI